MNSPKIALRINAANPDHHLWNNNGTWFVPLHGTSSGLYQTPCPDVLANIKSRLRRWIPTPPANLMKITKVQVKVLPPECSYCPDRCYGQTKYEAEAIEHRGYYFYRVGKRVIGIEKWEYERVCEYGVLHYFTTALKLHYRLGLEPGSRFYEV
jgi:hypothetical protein